MRIFNKYLYTAAALCLSMGFLTSCDEDKVVEYQPAPAGNSQPYYFTVQTTRSVSLGDSDYEVDFNLYRASVDQASSVSLEWSGDTDMFISLPSSATFEDDALMSTVTIELDPSKFDASQTYDLKVTIPGTENTPYSQNYLEFSFRYFPMSDWAPFGYDEAEGRDGMGAYTFAQYYSGTENPVYVEYRYSLLDENQVEYRFQWLIDYEDPTLGWETFLTAESSDGGATISVPEQVFAFNANYGDVYVSDMYAYTGDSGFNDSYFDEVTGTFWLDVIYYVDAGYFGYGYETCVMNGYMDTADYSISLTNAGTVTIDDTKYQLVNISWTEAVDLVAYTVVDTASVSEGDEVSDELIQEVAENIADGKVDATVPDDQGIITFTFPASGEYTIVAAGFKAENDGSLSLKTNSYLSVEFQGLDPNEGWESLGWVEYTDGYICSSYLVPAVSYYVELQKSEDYLDFYRLVDPYAEAYPFNEPGDWSDKFHGYLYFDLFDPNFIYIDYSEQNLNWGDGYMICYCLALNEYNGGKTEEEVYEEGLTGSFDNDKLTFPYQSLMWSMDSGSNWMYGNREIDIDYYEETGQVVPVTDADGNPVAPFCVDFNTLTDDPLAAAASVGTRASIAKAKRSMMNQGASIPAQNIKKHAKVVKFKSQNLKAGKRTAYRTTLQHGLR